MRASVRIAIALGLGVLIAGASPVLASGTEGESTNPKIESRVLQDTADGREASFLIHLASQADLSAAYAMKNEDARGRYVFKTLKQNAASTQAPIRALLAAAAQLPLRGRDCGCVHARTPPCSGCSRAPDCGFQRRSR